MKTKTFLLFSFLLLSALIFAQSPSPGTYLANAKNALKEQNGCIEAAMNYKMYKKTSGKKDAAFSQSLKSKCGSEAEINSAVSADDEPIKALLNSLNANKITKANQLYDNGKLVDAAVLYLQYMEDNASLFRLSKNAEAKAALLEKVQRCLGNDDDDDDENK